MPGYSVPTRESDPIHNVRTVGRFAQMIVELRDEYVRDPRPDTLNHIVRRLDELNEQAEQLRKKIEELSDSEPVSDVDE